MSATAIDFFSSHVISDALAKLVVKPFPDIGEVRFWLRKANEVVNEKEISWKDLGMNTIAWKTLLRHSYLLHLLYVRRMQELLAETISENLDRELDIEDAEMLQGIVDEINIGKITEAELKYEISSLEKSIY